MSNIKLIRNLDQMTQEQIEAERCRIEEQLALDNAAMALKLKQITMNQYLAICAEIPLPGEKKAA